MKKTEWNQILEYEECVKFKDILRTLFYVSIPFIGLFVLISWYVVCRYFVSYKTFIEHYGGGDKNENNNVGK